MKISTPHVIPMKAFAIVMAIVILNCGLTFSSCAEETTPPQQTKSSEKSSTFVPAKIDNQVFSYYDFIWEFLNVSIPSNLWMQDDGNHFAGIFTATELSDQVKAREDFGLTKQYLKEFWAPNHKLPTYGAITKWDKKEILIQYGWPWEQIADEATASINEGLSRAIPAIKEASGLNLRVVSGQSADIILLPTSTELKDDRSSTYKVSKFRDRHGNDSWWFKKSINGGIEFTPNSDQSVDGFMLADKSNNIKQAFCFIPTKLDKGALEYLVSECLVRAMGLPGFLSSADEALLGRAKIGKTSANSNYPRDNVGNIKISEKASALFAKSGLSNKTPVSELDYLLIQTLYCHDLKPGMDKNAIAGILMRDRKCLSVFQE